MIPDTAPGGLPKPVMLQWTWVDAKMISCMLIMPNFAGGRNLTRCSSLRSETSRNSTCCWYNRCRYCILLKSLRTKSSQEFLSICLFIPFSDAILGINVWLQEHTGLFVCVIGSWNLWYCIHPMLHTPCGTAEVISAGGSHLQSHETTSRRSAAANAAVGGGAKHWNVGQPSGVPVWSNTFCRSRVPNYTLEKPFVIETWKNLGSISVRQLLLLVLERMFDFHWFPTLTCDVIIEYI